MRTPQKCDCGAIATHSDGSGPFCDDCADYISRIVDAIDDKIRAERGETDIERTERHQARCREYARTHKAEARARWQKHQAKRRAQLGNADVKFNAYAVS